MQFPFFIIISGPTGVGKTDFALLLCSQLSFPVEIINADMGQFYTPLSIGTAKPDYVNQPIKHHLFDVVDEPRDFSVAEYRKKVLETMHDLWSRGVTPLCVGGSAFYLQSLFFPPADGKADKEELPASYVQCTTEELWAHLLAIDPVRAKQIHPRDRYRIERALSLWYHEGKLPSACVPQFDPPGMCAFYYITRERNELYARINERVQAMIEAGWIEEVKKLTPAWHEFLVAKKLIGYPEIIDFLSRGESSESALEVLAEEISKKTRAYAKRQLTFWRMLKRKLKESDPQGLYIKKIEELDVTSGDYESSIHKLRDELIHLYEGK